jgi:hypothetical protein
MFWPVALVIRGYLVVSIIIILLCFCWFKSNAGLQPNNFIFKNTVMKYLFCVISILLGVLLSGIPSLNKVDARVVSVLGWAIALLISTGGK